MNWRASSFYFPEHEKVVRKNVNKHFKNNKEYIMDKHVMAYIGKKDK